MAHTTLHSFHEPAELDPALAAALADRLRLGLENNGAATLAVSGGRTPAGFFRALSQADLDWANISVTLVDERCVGEDSPFSNTASVRQHLLTGKAARAKFLPLYVAGEDFSVTLERLRHLPTVLDAVVLGMGEDGHTASIFPDSPQREAALHDASGNPALRVTGKAPVVQRVTLTAPRILASQAVFLHITGHAKWQILGKALECRSAELPVSHFLHAEGIESHVFWAP